MGPQSSKCPLKKRHESSHSCSLFECVHTKRRPCEDIVTGWLPTNQEESLQETISTAILILGLLAFKTVGKYISGVEVTQSVVFLLWQCKHSNTSSK